MYIGREAGGQTESYISSGGAGGAPTVPVQSGGWSSVEKVVNIQDRTSAALKAAMLMAVAQFVEPRVPVRCSR